MKTEQEQIEEMAKQMCGDKDTFAKDLCSCCIAWDDCLEEAGNLYKAGYRKASEVIDELVDKVLEKIKYEYENYPNAMTVGTYHQLRKEINAIATEMRQEVEK